MAANNLSELKMFTNPQKQKNFYDVFKYEVRQFCLKTSLHGYRFIVLPKRVLLERVIWFVLVIAAMIAVIVLLLIAWSGFQLNPTFVVTDSTHYPIWNYPFPAVSICDINKMNKERVIELATNLSKLSAGVSVDDLILDIRLLFQLVRANSDTAPLLNYTRLQNLLESSKLKPHEVLKWLAPTCEETLQRCKWKGEEKICSSLFEVISSTEGFCCAFNYLALRNHTFEGYVAHKPNTSPRRVSACGYQTALEVVVQNEPKDYYLTQIPSIGHRVLIHNSYYFPDVTVQTVLTEMKIVNMVDIIPAITYSTDNIKNMDISKRGCIFNHEKKLLNFDGYNYHNCIIECRMNLSVDYCNCIPFYFYNPAGNFPKNRICDLRDVACLIEYKSIIFSSVPGFDFRHIPKDHVYGTEKDSCDCKPDCDYVSYIAEPSSGRLNRVYATNQLNLYGGLNIVNQSVVRVFFDDLVATRNRRDVTFSWHTLLAYYGGLLGLFVGFSFVSAIEFVYFFTIRFIADINKGNKAIREVNKNQSQKINVQPIEYLDPKKLLFPNESIRHRANSNSMFYNS